MNLEGIIPVMLTPFDDQSRIDWDDYETLIEWYLERDVDALFAVCQSSEMFYLSLEERRALAAFTVQKVAGRVPVIASGHVADDMADQLNELGVMADSGIDALVLVSNRLANRQALESLVAALPSELKLGMYECPYPKRKLLDDDDFRFVTETERFYVLKDVSCDLATVERRISIAHGTQLSVQNANAAIAWPVFQAGGAGFCGVANNIHPELYAWLYANRASDDTEVVALRDDLVTFLTMAALIESQGYPGVTKRYHQRIGTFKSTHCRAPIGDLDRDYYALDENLDALATGSARFTRKILELDV